MTRDPMWYVNQQSPETRSATITVTGLESGKQYRLTVAPEPTEGGKSGFQAVSYYESEEEFEARDRKWYGKIIDLFFSDSFEAEIGNMTLKKLRKLRSYAWEVATISTHIAEQLDKAIDER